MKIILVFRYISVITRDILLKVHPKNKNKQKLIKSNYEFINYFLGLCSGFIQRLLICQTDMSPTYEISNLIIEHVDQLVQIVSI